MQLRPARNSLERLERELPSYQLVRRIQMRSALTHPLDFCPFELLLLALAREGICADNPRAIKELKNVIVSVFGYFTNGRQCHYRSVDSRLSAVTCRRSSKDGILQTLQMDTGQPRVGLNNYVVDLLYYFIGHNMLSSLWKCDI